MALEVLRVSSSKYAPDGKTAERFYLGLRRFNDGKSASTGEATRRHERHGGDERLELPLQGNPQHFLHEVGLAHETEIAGVGSVGSPL